MIIHFFKTTLKFDKEYLSYYIFGNLITQKIRFRKKEKERN